MKLITIKRSRSEYKSPGHNLNFLSVSTSLSQWYLIMWLITLWFCMPKLVPVNVSNHEICK